MSGLLNNAQSFIVRQSSKHKRKTKKEKHQQKACRKCGIWQRKSSLNGAWEADIKYVLMIPNKDVRMSVQ